MEDASGKRDFNKEAASWDIPPRVKMAEDVAGALRGRLRLNPEMDVLDFGCGTGLLSLALRPEVRSVTGADSSPMMIEAFRNKISSSSLEGVRAILLEKGRETEIPGKYNLIVSNMVLHHVPDIDLLFKSFRKALLPGGYIALSDLDAEGGQFHRDPQGVFHEGFQRGAVSRMLAEAGFENIEINEAAKVERPGKDGVMRIFTIFLAIGRLPEEDNLRKEPR
ncbi:MAG: class I SAM-dependent methyltransferase [Candidatus Omnitrophica bacterium]|jgi:2-polyprenyl-3-methyl-5-hydroxy-6-metoxy-1,4-benzoquinol methylase|nr:class I SAM-dependent methyltransferase [Candidatus Omnitrophota bacterium]